MGDQNTLVCVLPCVPLRVEPNDCSEQVNQIISGELVIKLEDCPGNWIKISSQSDGYEGYADPRHFNLHQSALQKHIIYKTTFWNRGEASHVSPIGSFVYKNDSNYILGDFILRSDSDDLGTSPNSLSAAAQIFLGTPYHWGGKTINGIDCSGLTQICARLLGIELKRDASDQSDQGAEVEWSERRVDDLAFFKNNEGKITHVGILNSEDGIIHASGEVRIDLLTKDGIVHSVTGEKTHSFSHFRRL
jgi:hypothetical protein